MSHHMYSGFLISMSKSIKIKCVNNYILEHFSIKYMVETIILRVLIGSFVLCQEQNTNTVSYIQNLQRYYVLSQTLFIKSITSIIIKEKTHFPSI